MKNVTIYTTSTCGYCKMAKSFFKDKNVNYKEVNVEADPAAAQDMIKKSGQMGVPVIDIDGQIVVGFDRGVLSELLGV
ncbi:MAG: NrdH-redoxin [Candidatus Doudnabacteria bacterium CG10_big_fil_rev_8_21_14_0_10_41_10]|uniref:NrdH-redoxin n=1 Tax=Candidatus Doudnabacteria bacterium CG10_big_fil_rev_8_21_14_0_10_41_10 TaxID=1974551 RepID=A0A2H0VEG9_9BACT|nr:MAG: NrdH-redoxin [Candidatus Doudnabacteria bacterium CG10_big_fil_rev_8_21_14_0_10_41_10]